MCQGLWRRDSFSTPERARNAPFGLTNGLVTMATVVWRPQRERRDMSNTYSKRLTNHKRVGMLTNQSGLGFLWGWPANVLAPFALDRMCFDLSNRAFLLLYDSKRTSSETEDKVCATILFFLFFLFVLMSLECSSVTNGNAKPRKPCISCVLAVRVRRVRLYIVSIGFWPLVCQKLFANSTDECPTVTLSNSVHTLLWWTSQMLELLSYTLLLLHPLWQ